MGKKRKRKVPTPESMVGAEVLIARAAGKVITVKRRLAIARVLDMAIWLWFTEKDPLCVHLLVMAPYNCLEALGKKTGKGPKLFARMDRDQFTLAYNFLRHASSNLNDALDFPPLANPILLFDAITSFERIFGTMTIFMHTFFAYITSGLVPDLEFSDGVRKSAAELLPKELAAEKVAEWSRIEYFCKASEVFAAQVAK